LFTQPTFAIFNHLLMTNPQQVNDLHDELEQLEQRIQQLLKAK
jgi:ubiquinone biosynthesis protein UbiJ